MITFICYHKCTTCQRAQKWLDDNNIKYELRNIKENNPSLLVIGDGFVLVGFKEDEWKSIL